ncbi:MAG: OmpH family outer membrane protein, partial [Acidobacteriota bacterium]|nr:OmpH family outer membrane protein [Acidobacteriota bacterium]
KEIQRKALAVQQIRDTAAREMQLEVGEAQDRFQAQLVAVINAYGQSEGFDLILEVGTVVYASKTIDVTTAIVDRFNEVVKPPAEQTGNP